MGSKEAASKDVEASKNPSDFNALFVKMLEDSKNINSEDPKQSRIKNINRHLKSTQNFRSLGLISLSDFLEIHSVVSSTFTTERECQELEWIETMLRMIDHKNDDPDMCFSILTRLLAITSQHPDMHKIIQGKYASKIVEIIASNPQTVSSLRCLTECLKEYSGPCGIFKNKIYDYCTTAIDSNDPAIINLSGKCLHLLQQSRGGSIGGSAHKKNWAEYHQKLLNTIEELFVKLIQTGETVHTGKSERLKLPDESEVKKNMPLMYAHQERFTRFKNLCIWLRISLIQPFPAPKSILMDWIVAFVDKSIMQNQTQINKKDGDRILPFVLNIEIQKCLLEVLQSLIRAVGRNILVHSKDVCDIFWRSLKSTNVPYDEFKIKEISSLRSTIYTALTEFIKTSPNNHFVFKNTENFLKEAFLDITPLQTEILLTLPNGQPIKKSKKKDPEVRRTLTGKTFDNCIKIHQDLCMSSLNFIKILLISNGTGMKPVLFKILTDKVLIVSYRFSSRELTQQDLYHSSQCRLLILEVIYNILLSPNVRNATPSSFMVELLRKFKDNDKNESLRFKTTEMLRTVEAVLHNRKDPIHFPADLKDFRDSWLFNEKIVKSFKDASCEESNGNCEANGDVAQVIQIDEDVDSGSDDVEFVETEELLEKPEEKVMEVASKKRVSISKNEEESPAKIVKKARAVTAQDSNENKEEDDILESLMADFCDE